MKTILLLLSVLTILSCRPVRDIQHREGQLIKTKVYIGRHLSSTPADRGTIVLTNMIIAHVKGQPAIPDSALCYIRLEEMRDDFHTDIASKLQRQWLTWYGSEHEYLLINNLRLNK